MAFILFFSIFFVIVYFAYVLSRDKEPRSYRKDEILNFLSKYVRPQEAIEKGNTISCICEFNNEGPIEDFLSDLRNDFEERYSNDKISFEVKNTFVKNLYKLEITIEFTEE